MKKYRKVKIRKELRELFSKPPVALMRPKKPFYQKTSPIPSPRPEKVSTFTNWCILYRYG